VVGDLLALFPHPKLIKRVVPEQEPVAFLARDGSRMPHPVQQFAGDSLDLCMAICLLLCSRPCQMVTSNFRALATIAFCLPTRAATRSNWADPLGVLFDGHPCCLNYHSTQLTAPLLGDAPCAIGLPRLLNAGRLSQHSPPGAKARGKTGHLPTGGQETPGRENPQPRQLYQKRTLLDPRVAGGKPTEFCFALPNQRFKRLLQAQILVDPEFLGKGQIQSSPPFPWVDEPSVCLGVDRKCVGATHCADD
jgi:hypothetical protein